MERTVTAQVIDPRRPWRMLRDYLRYNPGVWTKGPGTLLDRSQGTCCLITGAAHFARVAQDDNTLASMECREALRHMLRTCREDMPHGIVCFNDNAATTYQDIMRVLDKAA